MPCVLLLISRHVVSVLVVFHPYDLLGVMSVLVVFILTVEFKLQVEQSNFAQIFQAMALHIAIIPHPRVRRQRKGTPSTKNLQRPGLYLWLVRALQKEDIC